MKKRVKIKTSKTKRSARDAQAPELPGLVEAMAKLVERLAILERKTDQVLSRVSNLPSEIRNAAQNFERPHQPTPPAHGQNPDARKERVMYQAICADCRKSCEVPFKPGSRPVYCKECWTIRKAGHLPQDPDSKSGVLNPQKMEKYLPSPMDYTPPQKKSASGGVAVLKKKPKTKKKSGKR